MFILIPFTILLLPLLSFLLRRFILHPRVLSRKMSEADSNSNKGKQVDWSNLPLDLLSPIADSLGLIEFLSFRAVCKEWQKASSTTPPPGNKPSSRELWLLMYGEEEEGSRCSLQKHSSERIYNLEIPEMDGATCLASYLGWLLLFRQGTMFFFCPISRARIELPNCPFKDLKKSHTAAFSSDPTSQGCIVVAASYENVRELELHMLRRGSDQWSKHKLSCTRPIAAAVKCSMFSEEEFHFLDKGNGLVIFNAETKTSNNYRLVNDNSANRVLSYAVARSFMVEAEKMIRGRMQGMMETKERDVSVCTTGTMFKQVQPSSAYYNVILGSTSETLEAGKKRCFGVWIQPRYFEIPADQKW